MFVTHTIAVDCPCPCRLLNPIHVAAIFRKLASICQPPNPTAPHAAAAVGLAPGAAAAAAVGGASLEVCADLLQYLQQQIKQQRCIGHGPRGLANILAAIAKLQCTPDSEMLPMLLDSFCSQIAEAVPQDIANVLWSVAQITMAFGVGSVPLGGSSSNNGSPGNAQSAAAAQSDEPAAAAAGEAVSKQGQVYSIDTVDCCSSLDAVRQAGPDQQQHEQQQQQQQRRQVKAPTPIETSNAPASPAAAAVAAEKAGEASNAAPFLHDDPDLLQQLQQQRRQLQQQQWQPPLKRQQQQQQQIFNDPLLSQQQVQLLLQHMCSLLQEAHCQIVSNTAWAVSVLQHCHCWCMCDCMPLLRMLFSHFAGLQEGVPRCAQNVLHCMVQVRLGCFENCDSFQLSKI
jgi:hypothetical protein